MSMILTHRVAALEAEMKQLRQAIAELLVAQHQEVKEPQNVNPQGPRQMCPKCGVKPAYHLHVVHCKGPWQGNGAAP